MSRAWPTGSAAPAWPRGWSPIRAGAASRRGSSSDLVGRRVTRQRARIAGEVVPGRGVEHVRLVEVEPQLGGDTVAHLAVRVQGDHQLGAHLLAVQLPLQLLQLRRDLL